MKRRIFAAVAALLMAAVGAVQLYSYVQRADQRATAGLETSEVLVVEAPIAEGTPADQLTEWLQAPPQTSTSSPGLSPTPPFSPASR
jgi:hypothetical protein